MSSFLARSRLFTTTLRHLSTPTISTLSLLKSSSDPETILRICRSTPSLPQDRAAFSLAIAKLKNLHHFHSIKTLLDHLKLLPHLQTDKFHSQTISLFGQAGMLPDAIRTFNEMDNLPILRTVKSVNALLSACLAVNDHTELERLYISLPDSYNLAPDLDTFNILIKSYCESGRTSEVYGVIGKMEEEKVRPNATTFQILIAGVYKEERFEEVERVLGVMRGCGVHPDVNFYNVMIHGLCKLKRSDEAKAVFNGLRAKGVKPNAVSCMHLVNGFAKEGKLGEARKKFEKMVESGYRPDGNCYFTMVQAFCEGEQFESALEFYKMSKEKNWIPGVGTMTLLVNGLVKIGKVDEGRSIVSEMKKRFPKAVGLWEEVESNLLL